MPFTSHLPSSHNTAARCGSPWILSLNTQGMVTEGTCETLACGIWIDGYMITFSITEKPRLRFWKIPYQSLFRVKLFVFLLFRGEGGFVFGLGFLIGGIEFAITHLYSNLHTEGDCSTRQMRAISSVCEYQSCSCLCSLQKPSFNEKDKGLPQNCLKRFNLR